MGIIQKQSIRSSLIIMVGFALGGLNVLLLSPKTLTPEQFGLTRVITDVGLTLATFATLGTINVAHKFFPLYKSYLPKEKNDLPFITLIICLIGIVLTSTAGLLLKDVIIRKYSAKAPLFVEYSYLVYPFAFFMLMIMWVECFCWILKRTATSNLFKEVLPRLLFTILLALYFAKLISFNAFVWLFAFSYLPPFLVLYFVLRRTGEFAIYPKVSSVTRRMKGRMTEFGFFLFGAQFLNLLSLTSDSLIISAKAERGLTDTAVFAVATYIITLMQVPQRSITAISIPVLSESWQNKDMSNIRHIYNSSVSNLLVIGLAMFGLLWLNADNLVAYLGKDYSSLKMLVFLLGIGKLIDLGTGANEQILATSRFWKVNFLTNVIYTCLAIPLNYVLISRYGLMGAAYSTLISHSVYNILRYAFLWYKFDLQPYSLRHLLALVIGLAAMGCAYIIPQHSSFIIDIMIRSAVFCVVFFPVIYWSKTSVEINRMIEKYLRIKAR